MQPSLENISVFDIDEFSKGLRKFEEEWTMFEEKPKPTAPTNDAQVNLATKKEGLKKWVIKVDKEEVNRLKKVASSEKFTTTSFMAHSEKVEAVTWKKDSGRLCYWCIESPCLKKRARQWENKS